MTQTYFNGDAFYTSMRQAVIENEHLEDSKLPETLQPGKAMVNSEHIDVQGLIDDMLESLDNGNHGGDVIAPEDDCFSSAISASEHALLKGLLTLWFDSVGFKMYVEDNEAEPVPFAVHVIAERNEERERKQNQARAEAAKLTRDYLIEQAINNQ